MSSFNEKLRSNIFSFEWQSEIQDFAVGPKKHLYISLDIDFARIIFFGRIHNC